MATKIKYFFVIALAVGIISHFFSWANFNGVISINGLSDQNAHASGRITFTLMIAALIITFISRVQDIILWANIICGGVGLLLLTFYITDLNGTMFVQANLSPGLYATVLVEIAILSGGLLLISKNRKRIQEQN